MVPQASRPECSGLESLVPATRRHLDQAVIGLAERRSRRRLEGALRRCRSQLGPSESMGRLPIRWEALLSKS